MDNELKKIGTFNYIESFEYFGNDDLSIIKDNNNKVLTNEDLNDWAVWINSPWSQNNEKYTIKCNCEDSYTKMEKDKPIWRCEYLIIGFEAITSSVIGYGFSEEEALKNCKDLFKYLQKNYNKKNESF